MSPTPTVYLISGANRGIGLGLVTALSQRDNVVVFAGTRNPSAATDLQALVKKYPGKVYIVKLTSADVPENQAAVAYIKEVAGRLDVVIANAGINTHVGPALDAPAQVLRDHFEVNVIGTLILFQAAYPLLKASTSAPKFIPISTIGGSLALATQMPPPLVAYGASKAAGNYLVRRLHLENDGLRPLIVTFPIHPGLVDTDMTTSVSSQIADWSYPAITVGESVGGLLGVIDKATREKDGGEFWTWAGDKLPW
ncbi:hypothetical protein PLICRDRAFT_244863 [Plicaturopsis crispa FD-325 SS-3]|nr:hypothetical protein PLICRDRAFT_244863 [Plicaturopsis crispa FD-325 SS-3]